MAALKIPMPKMPSDEELRVVSLAWIERVGPTLIDRWPTDVLALSMPTKFIPLSVDLLEPLFEPSQRPHAGLNALAAEMDAAMGWDRHFIRLNSRSPKDAAWPFEVPATCSGKEAVAILGSSERVLDDLCYFRRIPEHPAYVCLREFIPGLRAHSEFRCFVRDSQLIAVTHYDYLHPTEGPEDGGRQIRERLNVWFLDVLKPRLHIETVVFDVFIPYGGEPLLIELNPYGLSDPCWLRSYAAVEDFRGFVAFSPPAERGADVVAGHGTATHRVSEDESSLPPPPVGEQ
jgi:hypothetical protein